MKKTDYGYIEYKWLPTSEQINNKVSKFYEMLIFSL